MCENGVVRNEKSNPMRRGVPLRPPCLSPVETRLIASIPVVIINYRKHFASIGFDACTTKLASLIFDSLFQENSQYGLLNGEVLLFQGIIPIRRN